MINHITIRDFAIIDQISLDFHQGFHVFTGETGSGKSIIIEAISMALGGRADSTYVQSGKEKASIELTVSTEDPHILDLLRENDLDPDPTLLISREIYSGGKSTCRINGVPVSVSFLNKLCKRIADLHGQYDHQSLLNPDHHLFLVDEYDKATILPARELVRELFLSYSDLKAKLSSLIRNREDRERKRDFMAFELNEINDANPLPGEDLEIEERLLLLQNSERIVQRLSHAYELLFEQTPSGQDHLGKAMQDLAEVSQYSENLTRIADTLSESYYRLDDLRQEMRKARDFISFSPDALAEAADRKDILEKLKRKYGSSLEKVLEYRDLLIKDIDRIENTDQLAAELSEQLASCEKQLNEASVKLSNLRKKAAEKIEIEIKRELSELNFKDAALFVEFSSPSREQPQYSESGTDRVEFFMTTNKGESPKSMAKIASGGEISRIMLAFKRIIGDYDHIPTFIFDEIDSGISGVTASIVGKKLKEISLSHQIICITHLPQIAAYSRHHYQIRKENVGERTFTRATSLNQQQKIDEVARLLGGIEITDITKKSAEELISQACL